MINLKHIILSCTLCLIVHSINYAQIVNIGETVVEPGTIVSMVSDFDNTSVGEFYNDGDVYVYSSFNNNGTVDYFNGGLTRFVGFDVQNISGSNRSYLYNALFSNDVTDDPFHLSGTISVANESNYDYGIVNNDDYGGLFVYEQDGYHINTSDYSHVDGTVLKEGNTEFKYPIGDAGYYRFAAISEPELESNAFDGKYFFENSDVLYPHENKEGHIEIIDDQEYWIVNRTLGDSDVFLTLSWRDVTTPLPITNNPEEGINIVRWDEVNNIWVDEGGIVDAENQTVTAPVTGYGVFTLARIVQGITLPCGLDLFNAVSADNDGINDYLVIDGLESECVDKLRIKIFNRWGVKVYESNDYGKNGDVFKGYSNGRLTVNSKEALPTGTYYYIVEVDYNSYDNTIKTHKTSGYLYLTKGE